MSSQTVVGPRHLGVFWFLRNQGESTRSYDDATREVRPDMRDTPDRMDHSPTTLDYVTLAIAVWGAGLSTVLSVARRRRRLTVGAEFGVARLGHIRNHGFFIVRVVNTGQRAVTIREVEWVAEGYTFGLGVFRTSKGPELPAKVEPDEVLQILFDIDRAAGAIAGQEAGDTPREIRVVASGARRPWPIRITEDMRTEAAEALERAAEEDDQGA